LELLQDVLVKRTSTLILTRTWNAHGTIGYSPTDRLAIKVRGSVREQVDEFLNAYLATNPKKNPKTR
jgi:hypothetical protein